MSVLVLTSACSSASNKYVTNKAAGVYVKVPDGWSHVRIQDPQLLGIDARQMSPDMYVALSQREWMTKLDASGSTQPTTALAPDSQQPNGFLQVRQLLPEEAKTISTDSLRNLLVSIDDAEAAQEAAIKQDPVGARLHPAFLLLADETVKKADGVHGVHLIYQLSTSAGLAEIDQTSLLDQNQTVLYQLVITCTALCYAQNSPAVDQVLRSFTIKPTSTS
ncbi:hypothetical protein [Pseudofrankia sp. DC12]|uniref:hypothetical protein n=1 Tax=Pseudofrankia sp. DC12 TaxID=683315 RepID=UPI0005F7C082|nr:hypothetical protein [Pseudofrankia sp. DC12]